MLNATERRFSLATVATVGFLQIPDNPHEMPKAAAAVLSANAAALGLAAFD